MKVQPFLISGRKLYELLFLLILNGVLYFIWSDLSLIILFSLGYVWNWAASQSVHYVVENQRYRFSFLRMVYNLQELFQKPFKSLHPALSVFPRILPAGLFWGLVIKFASSELPWWPTFLGSFIYEVVQLDSFFMKKDLPPESSKEEKTP